MAENNVNIEIRNDFNQIFGIISYHRQRVSKTIDDESLRMIWEVGGYISHKLKIPIVQIRSANCWRPQIYPNCSLTRTRIRILNLCQLNWHKFLMSFFLQDGAIINLY